MVSYSHSRKDYYGTANPDVSTEENRSNTCRNGRLQLMVAGVEYGYEVPNQTIIAQNNAVVGHDRRPRVDKDAFAQYEASPLRCAQFNWHGFAAQYQTTAFDRTKRDDDRVQSVYRHHSRPSARPAESRRGQEAFRYLANLHQRSHLPHRQVAVCHIPADSRPLCTRRASICLTNSDLKGIVRAIVVFWS